jgi:hypothetical protein
VEKVLEKLATSEKTTIVLQREVGGKIRVTSGSWDGEKVILKGEVLEVRNVDGRLHVARKARKPDEWDPPIEPYDPYEPGQPVTGDAIIEDPPVTLTPIKSPGAERARRYRKRRRHGLYWRPIRVTREQLDRLEIKGYLDPDRRGDAADEIDAIERRGKKNPPVEKPPSPEDLFTLRVVHVGFNAVVAAAASIFGGFQRTVSASNIAEMTSALATWITPGPAASGSSIKGYLRLVAPSAAAFVSMRRMLRLANSAAWRCASALKIAPIVVALSTWTMPGIGGSRLSIILPR